MFVLNSEQRLAVLLGCVSLLCTVILLTICFVCPACLFFKLINKSKSKQDLKERYILKFAEESYFGCEPPPPYEDTADDVDSVAGIPLPMMEEAVMSIPIETKNEETGNVSITLCFKHIREGQEDEISILRLEIKEAYDLPIRAYGGQCNPYFSVGLIHKTNKRRRKSKLVDPALHEFQTTVVKKNQFPVYNESFFFPLQKKDMKKRTLKIQAWDQDKWANDTLLGEVFLNLVDVHQFLTANPSKDLDLNLKLEDSKMVNGQILLGLCYLPTAERMTLAILKAHNLNICNDEKNDADIYVQAMAIHGGKLYERRKTSSRPSSSFAVFNEMLMFDVPYSKLDQVTLLITVRNFTVNETFKQDTKQLTTKDECIGKVVMGSKSRKNCLSHWITMRNSPRRQVIQWHELR